MDAAAVVVVVVAAARARAAAAGVDDGDRRDSPLKGEEGRLWQLQQQRQRLQDG